MADAPFIGKIYFERGDDSSPVAYDRICQAFGISGLGKTRSLEDVTTFCDEGNRTYIGGLADGNEITVECNYEQANEKLRTLISDVDGEAARDYRLVVEQASPFEIYTFSAVALSWELGPSVDGKNTISFTFKVSGAISVDDAE
jgi:hypothetical protein